MGRSRMRCAATQVAARMVVLVAVGSLVLGACSYAETATDAPLGSGIAATAPATDAPADPAKATGPARPSTGCTAPDSTAPPVASGRATDRTVSVAAADRVYREYVPTTAAAGTPVPLVVDLHGLSGTRERQAGTSRWEPLADREQIMVVTPQGLGAVPSWLANDTPDNADLAFMRALLDQVEVQRCIDTSRVYFNGISNGGLMSSLVACRLRDRVAAVGLVAGINTIDACAAGPVVPMIIFWGKRDCVLPFYGGLGPCLMRNGGTIPTAPVTPEPGGVRPVEDAVAVWAERDGCDPAPVVTSVSEHVERRQFGNCTDGALVDFYVIADGSHSWPGSPRPVPESDAVNGVVTGEIDATTLMWQFFQRYQVPA